MPHFFFQHRRLILLACGAGVSLMGLFAVVHYTSQEKQQFVLLSYEMPGGLHPSAPAAAVVEPEMLPLAERSVTVTLTSDQKDPVTATMSMMDHPEWVIMENGILGSDERVSAVAVQAFLEQEKGSPFPVMRIAQILASGIDAKKVLRATTSGVAKPGYVYDTAAIAQQIAQALMYEQSDLHFTATYSLPFITAISADGQAKQYELLGTGMSDFADSDAGRESNVHKAIEERVNNVIVPAGATFSLIDALDAPITEKKGWKMALGLFGGGAALTVGGGICQSATTVYRAALLSGLPIVEKRNHSLFVDHYEFYGVGLDATVFPGFHDVRYKNDTGDDLLMQAYTEGVTVYVHFYGRNDGRTAYLDGPYFARSKNRPKELRALSTYEIGWVRTVTAADGTTKVQPLIATYSKPVWYSIFKKYDGADGMALMTSLKVVVK